MPLVTSIDNVLIPEQDAERNITFKSFAIFDLETSGLPNRGPSRIGITEISVLGFAVNELKNYLNSTPTTNEDESNDITVQLPKLPRILHKLTLVVNPRTMIHPEAEKITGLDNFALEDESSFNDNAAETFIGFLKHLQQPVCLVAHNGNRFDFPIIKYMLNKNKKSIIPLEIYCLDSMEVFHDVDEIRKLDKIDQVLPISSSPNEENDVGVEIQNSKTKINVEQIFELESYSPEEIKQIDETVIELEKTPSDPYTMQKLNETTPNRPTRSLQNRKIINNRTIMKPKNSKARRSLFCDSTETRRRFPPKNLYKLDNLFERHFNKPPINSHDAESDVKTLAHLVLHYGADFQKYAEKHAKPFQTVQPLYS